ncbi:aminopeptidase [Candidatus Woesearchaeota archaeon]|nr:aminopeptidase [Candidatus Woesearchaeota archaeon]
MDTIQSIQWLKHNGLYELTEKTSFYLKKIFNPCFGVTNEKVLIMGDKGFSNKRIAPVLSGAYYLAAKSLNLDTKLVIQDIRSRGDSADSDVIESLRSLEEKNVVFINMSDKLGSLKDVGKSFRKFCEKRKHRFVSALSLGDLPTKKMDDVIAAIDVDYKPLRAKHKEVKDILDPAKEINVRTEAGTDLYYNVDGMKAISVDGSYNEPGKGGNLPAGEVYIPCNSSKVEGKVVIDGSSRNHKHTTLIKKPITLKIEQGSLIGIEGGEEAKKLENTLKWAAGRSKNPKSVYKVGELGIGLNPKAKIIGSTLIDEKTLGTAHIGIGSNYWFGGTIYAIIHLDQIFRNPEITVDGRKLSI